MATYNAGGKFDGVKSSFETKSGSILTILEGIATQQNGRVTNQSLIGENAIVSDAGFVNVPTAVVPSYPGEDSVMTRADAFLAWLQEQASIIGVDMPDYTEIIKGEPTRPTINVDDIPTYATLDKIDKPVIEIPEWNEESAWGGSDELMAAADQPITATFQFTEEYFQSALLDDDGDNILYDFIKADLTSRDFGIDPNTEERLFERAREREQRVLNSAVDGTTRLFSTGGFEAPTGAAQAALYRVQAEARDKIASLNRDLAAKRAELYLEAKKVAVAHGLQLEQTTMNFYNAKNDRILKVATQQVESAIAIAAHNLQRINILLEKYKAFAQVFEARAKAATSLVDLYKAQVEAEGLKASVNKSLVDEFVAKNKAVVDTYAEQVKGYAATIDSTVRYFGVLSDYYKAQSEELSARIGGHKSAYDIAAGQESNQVQFLVGKYNADVSSAKTKLEEVMGALNFRLEQFKLSAQSAATLASAAMSALNVNLGLSVGASATVGASESENEDVSAGVQRKSYSESKDLSKGTKTYSESTNISDGGTDSRLTTYNYNS